MVSLTHVNGLHLWIVLDFVGGSVLQDTTVMHHRDTFNNAQCDIEVVFGRENVNKQLRIKAPKKLPAVFAQGTLDL